MFQSPFLPSVMSLHGGYLLWKTNQVHADHAPALQSTRSKYYREINALSVNLVIDIPYSSAATVTSHLFSIHKQHKHANLILLAPFSLEE